MNTMGFQMTEQQAKDLSDLKTKTLMKPLGRVRRPRIRKRDPNHIPRPVNSFLAYRTEMQAVIRTYCPLANHRDISKIVAKWWHESTEKEKQTFKDKAEEAKSTHAKMYPDYKFNPKKKKAAHLKKNSKKLDTSPQKKRLSESISLDETTDQPTENAEKDLQKDKAMETSVSLTELEDLYVQTATKTKPNLSPCLYSFQEMSSSTVYAEDGGQLNEYVPQDSCSYPFKYGLLDNNPIQTTNYLRNTNLYQDYVLISESSSFYYYTPPSIPFYDLTPISHPLLTPEPEFSYTNLTTHPPIPSHMLSMDDCWYNQLHYY